MQMTPFLRNKLLSKEVLYLFLLNNSSQYFMAKFKFKAKCLSSGGCFQGSKQKKYTTPWEVTHWHIWGVAYLNKIYDWKWPRIFFPSLVSSCYDYMDFFFYFSLYISIVFPLILMYFCFCRDYRRISCQ